ncbi:hypothetical protein NLU13_9390 [Sarocladium strictum]|uniref:Delta 8-(E)-sphingolipid desaturase n=1 Tax=Sarocladium strictum TaxID=5046 RepID=A0AA39L4D5_SARSR|nr:hypothetical protein NLU13_9390 [Sarocladium strictum]
MGRDETLTPRAVEGMIADGGILVIYEEHVLKLNGWMSRHPGGSLAILHMVGRDATDEMKALHSASTLQTIKAFRIGRKPAGPWTNMTPPIRGGVYRKPQTIDASPDLIIDRAYLSETDSSVSDSESSSSPHSAKDGLAPLDDQRSLASSVTSVYNSSDDDSVEALKKKVCSASDLLGPDMTGLRQRALPPPAREAKLDAIRRLSPTEYTAWAVEQDIDRDLSEYPSLEPAVQQDITQKYRDLHQKVQDMGYYECPYTEYGKECIRYITLFTGFITLLHYEWYIASAICLGVFWQQIMFTAHDAGHRAITHVFWIDTLIGLFIADLCCGLSIGWWKSSHNVHHLITNQPEHDPDIQNLPLFATSPLYFRGITSSYYNGFVFAWDKAAELLVPIQKYTYYPIMAIARFNLYLLSWLHVLSSKSTGLGSTKAWWIRPTEMAFMTGYWFLFGYCLLWRSLPTWTIRVVFVLVSHVFMAPLHVQINLSHWGMSTSDLGEGESFPQRQLRTTMDVDCPAWMDFVHGGLQFQAIHHLFPRVPRHNLRKVQGLVREFCQDTGIPYSILTFVDGNKKVLGRLGEVGEQVSMLVNCQKHMAETGEMGLH